MTDCEHYGDINRAIHLLSSLNCDVNSFFWDKKDCGESYVDFSFLEKQFVKIYQRLGSEAKYDADINQYLSFEELPFTRHNHISLSQVERELRNDLSCGFYNRLPLRLFFCCDTLKYKNLTPFDVVTQCLSYLEDVTIIGYYFDVVDGSTYCNVLMKSSYRNLTAKRIQDGIGDYCLGHNGWMAKNKIYGECTCTHSFLNKGNFWYYDYLQYFVECLKEKKSLIYKEDKYYNAREIVLTHKQYFDKRGHFKPIVEVNGVNFKMKDPRFWMKIIQIKEKSQNT